MLGQSTAHHQRGARNQRRIQANALAVFFAVNVETEVVSFSARLPEEKGALCSRLVFADARGAKPCRRMFVGAVMVSVCVEVLFVRLGSV